MAPSFRCLLCLHGVAVFFFFFVLTVTYFEKFEIHFSQSSSTGHGRSEGRTNVVIVSQGRGGSTFLGEIFNNNPSVFYVYEPLYLAGSILDLNVFYMRQTEEYSRMCEDILQSLLRCDFSNQTTRILDALSGLRGLRSKSKVLSGPEACSQEYRNRPGRSCQKLSSTRVKQVCQDKKHTVLKVLVSRLPNRTIASLMQYLTGKHDMKIIQLVRDPRPVVYSWVKNSWIKGMEDPNLVDNIRRICKPIYENIDLAEVPPTWLRGRYKLVHYEELALQPLKVAREIYAFLGFFWPLEVEKWINSTKRKAEKRTPKNPYSTVRNGTAEVTRWQSEAPSSLIRLVEETCGDLLDRAGYEPIIKRTNE